MVESSDRPSILNRIRSYALEAHASDTLPGADDKRPAPPVTDVPAHSDAGTTADPTSLTTATTGGTPTDVTVGDYVPNKSTSALPPPAPPPGSDPESGHREASSSVESDEKPNVMIRFFRVCKDILFSSWINLLLVFVPVGIAVQVSSVSKTVVFAINAIAIIPLAGLLSHATESVASEMGDTIGALMNITFGNAVELIIL